MIQFNLLPDVKIQYIKARRMKHLMTLASIIVIGVSVFVFLLMMTTVNVVQKKSLRDLNDDIQKYSTELKSTKDLDKILTVQNQLGTLTGLHDAKPVTSRLFTYLAQMTQPDVSLSDVKLDLDQNTITVTGKAPSQAATTQFTNTIKVAMYSTAGSSSGDQHAFKDVVLSSFGRDASGSNFSITASFDPAIFSNDGQVTLKVPNEVTTDPATLFSGDN